MNATPEVIKVQAFGNWFEFKPEAIKVISNDALAHFLVTDKKYMGLVSFPEDVFEKGMDSKEFKETKEQKKKEGIDARVKHLQRVIQNLEVSLKRDLEQANIKADPMKMASPGEVAAYKELAKYAQMEQDAEESKAKEISKLKEKINGKSK